MSLLRIFFLGLLTVSAPLSADYCLPVCGEIGIGYDYFRSLPEGDWEGNTGGFVSVNFAGQGYNCPRMQFGASYGIYDWHGRCSAFDDESETQQQVFITLGIFNRNAYCSGLNIGLVYDWMWSKNFGIFGSDVHLDQLRFQAGYPFGCREEFGLWGTLDLHWSRHHSREIDIDYHAISQINAYWKHYFDNGTETMLWLGTPYRRSLLSSSGRAGKFIIGGSFSTPLACRFSLDGHAMYMYPHSSSGCTKQRNYAANICLELKWAFQGSGDCCMPLMPLANNSLFIVDTNHNF